VELAYQNVSFSPSIHIPIEFDGEVIRNFEIKVPLVANKMLCGITAGPRDL